MAWELKLEPKATFWHPQKTRIEAWGAFRGHWGGGGRYCSEGAWHSDQWDVAARDAHEFDDCSCINSDSIYVGYPVLFHPWYFLCPLWFPVGTILIVIIFNPH